TSSTLRPSRRSPARLDHSDPLATLRITHLCRRADKRAYGHGDARLRRDGVQLLRQFPAHGRLGGVHGQSSQALVLDAAVAPGIEWAPKIQDERGGLFPAAAYRPEERKQ